MCPLLIGIFLKKKAKLLGDEDQRSKESIILLQHYTSQVCMGKQ